MDASWTLIWNRGLGVQSKYASTTQPMQNWLQQAAAVCGGFGIPSLGVISGGNFDGIIQCDQQEVITQFANLPLAIKDDYMGASDYTNGNAANTATLTVLYTIIDV